MKHKKERKKRNSDEIVVNGVKQTKAIKKVRISNDTVKEFMKVKKAEHDKNKTIKKETLKEKAKKLKEEAQET